MSLENDRKPSDQAEEAKSDHVRKGLKGARLAPSVISGRPGSGWTTRRMRGAYQRVSFRFEI